MVYVVIMEDDAPSISADLFQRPIVFSSVVINSDRCETFAFAKRQ